MLTGQRLFLYLYLLAPLCISIHIEAAPFAYVCMGGGRAVVVINIATNSVIGSPIRVGISPLGIAITPSPSLLSTSAERLVEAMHQWNPFTPLRSL